MTSKVPLVTVMTNSKAKAKAKAKERILVKANLKEMVPEVRVLSFVIRARANMEALAVTVMIPRTLGVRLLEL